MNDSSPYNTVPVVSLLQGTIPESRYVLYIHMVRSLGQKRTLVDGLSVFSRAIDGHCRNGVLGQTGTLKRRCQGPLAVLASWRETCLIA